MSYSANTTCRGTTVGSSTLAVALSAGAGKDRHANCSLVKKGTLAEQETSIRLNFPVITVAKG